MEAVTFMQQILSGVEYLHQNHIAHRYDSDVLET